MNTFIACAAPCPCHGFAWRVPAPERIPDDGVRPRCPLARLRSTVQELSVFSKVGRQGCVPSCLSPCEICDQSVVELFALRHVPYGAFNRVRFRGVPLGEGLELVFRAQGLKALDKRPTHVVSDGTLICQEFGDECGGHRMGLARPGPFPGGILLKGSTSFPTSRGIFVGVGLGGFMRCRPCGFGIIALPITGRWLTRPWPDRGWLTRPVPVDGPPV